MQIRDLPYPDPGVPDVRSGFRLLLWLGHGQPAGQLKALVWGVLHLAAIASFPVVAGIAVNAVVARSGDRLALAGALLLAVTVAMAVGETMLHRVAVTNWITAAARIQQLLARRTSELGATLTRRVAAGEVVAVSTGDIERIGWCVEAVSRFSAALLTTLGVCAALTVYEPRLGLLACAGMLALALTVLPLLPRATRRADVQRERAGRATELAADTVAGLRVLRGIGGEDLFLTRYRAISQQVRHAAVRTARMWSFIEALQVALPGLLLVGVVWYGTRLALDGRIAVGELVTVYGAVTFLLVPLQLFSEFAMSYSFSRPSAARAARVLALRRPGMSDWTSTAPISTVGNDGTAARADADCGAGGADSTGGAGARGSAGRGTPSGAERAQSGAGRTPGSEGPASDSPGQAPVSGRRLPGREARVTDPAEQPETAYGGGGDTSGLHDPLTGLFAPAGRLTAVVCGDPDAAGLLAERLGGHPLSPSPQAGASVLLDGAPLDSVPLERARTRVLVQDKDPVLLSGTLTELFDVPASGTVTAGQALEAAQCADVLTALAQGSPDAEGDPSRARITERGRSLSGGQRQRLALARSLFTDPEVLVLDEPTSAVDSHTEARIADALGRLRSGRTTVVFSSSPLLLDRADRVVLILDGTAAASGTHRQLLRSDAAYQAVVTRAQEGSHESPHHGPERRGPEDDRLRGQSPHEREHRTARA